MSRSKRLFNLIAIVAMLSLIVSPLPAPSVQAQGKARAADSGLYRTRIHLPSFVARDRLDKMGVVVLADNSPGLLVLVDGAQLTDLARLRFEPRVTDDLAALLAEAAPEKAWLGIGLQPLLAAARAVVTAEKAGSGKTEALAALRLTMADLPNELRAGISVLNSVDDDADGLTNTEEAWWCTNPLNPNSDGDASGYADGQEVAALLNFTLSRTVRWGYGPPFGPPAAWPNFNNRDGTGVNVCNDGDYDTIPDYAEAYMVGTRVGAGDSENTDGDKFDDGQELFGTTFCPGGTASCGYGNYPRTQDYSFITSGMPSWIRPPGDSPFVSAYPVIDFLVDPATVKVTAKEIRTIERTITQGEEVSTGFAETVGASTTVGTVDTNTHSTWQENSTTEGGIEPGSVAAIQFQVPSTDGSALAWDTSNNSYVPVKPPDPERPLSAADEKAIDFAVAAFAATIAPRPTDYEPFQVEGLRGDGDFAILSLASYPSERPSDAEMIVPQLLIGVAHRETDRWNIYVQGMSAYDNTLRSLPDTILSEAGKAILLTQATPRTTYNVRGLPWKIGTSWRYNQGPHGNENAWDFGTPSAGVAADIYTAESGLVVNSKETCIAIRRPGDGLILWYQHIASSAVKNFPIGSEVGFSQRLGPTTIADGCSGYSTGHHIHFFLNAPMQNPPPPTWKPFDPQGSTLNGWRIAAEKLIKNGVEKLPNQSDKISHDGNQQTDKQACQAPPIKSTDPNQTTPNVSTGNRFVEFFERLGRQVKSWFGLGGGSVRLAGTDSFVSGASGTPLNYSDFRSDQQCGGSPSPSTGSAPGGGGSGITLNDDGDGTFSSLRVWSQTQTTGEGRSTSHSELRSETSYREITRSSTNTLVSSEAWSTATTTDPTDAGQLTFNYNLYNTGSDAAVRLTGLKINVLIGDLPVITWTPADTFFDIFPGQAKGPFSSAPLKLTLEQLAAIDNGAPIRVILADYGYDDNLYDANAWGRSILFHVDDGPGDGDETIDTYLITTNLVQGETYQDTLARYFDATTFQGAPGDERNGTLTAIRTPEFAGDGEITGWNDHPVNDHAWWELSISLGGETDGVQHFRDMPAKAKTDVYLRYVLDTDGDGFSDRAELDAGSDPNDPDIHPRPLITVAQHTTVSGGSASVQVTLQNDGNLDASSVELWAIAADDSITISDNLVGGGGRVRAGRQVVLGARIGKPDLTAWQTSTAKPYPDGQYEGTSPKTFKFQALDSGNIGAGTLRVKWSNDNGATWQPTPLALGSGYTAWTPLALSDGLTVAFSGGYVALNETFTFATALPIDTFAYTINRTPYTPPLIIASYNDPEGNHKFVSDVELPDIQADLAPYLSDMRFGFQLDVMAPAPFATGANTAHLVFNNPAAQAISGTNLYVEFATPDGTVAKEYVLENQTLLPGPTVVTLAWDTADFNPAFDPAADYHILVFAADRQGTIFENTVKKLEQIGHDQLPLAVLPDATWDFGAAQQGTLLKHTMAAANIGYHELLTFVQGGPGLSLSDSGTRHLPAGDLALYDLTLNTAQLPVGPYQSTVTIRTSDPANPTRTVHVVGSVTAAPADNPVGAMQRPLDWPATVSGNQGQWVEFTHTLGPDPQMLHPVKVYSQDYGTLKGVGKYATAFGSATASYDMFGDGRDGVMPSSGNLDYNNGVGVAIVNSGSAGAYSINVTDAYAGWRINPGDAVLIHQTQGAGAGCWELNRAVSDFTGGAAAIQLAKPLQCNYASSGNNHAQIQRVPQYTDCPVSGTVTSLSSWNGTRGGILAVMCNGVMNLSGSLDVSNAGYRGVVTPGSGPPYYDGSQGEGTEGPGGAYSYWPNGNAGGGGRGDNSTGGDGRVRGSGGGGGGNAYSGNTGVPDQGNLHTAGIGGQSSGNPELTSMTFGGAGGAPGYDATTNTYGQRGGNGGGIVVILAKAFSVPGSIIADGETTSTGYGGRSGGHGGGAGGSILIRTSIGALSGGMISARGGVGTYGWQGANGGDGSVGRIRIEHCETFSGSTNPPPSTLHLNCYIAEQVESAPYTTTRLNLPESGSHTYQVQYGRKLHWGGAANQVTTLRVPAALFTSVTLQSLVSDLPSNASFALDIGNTGSDSWNGTVGNGGEYTSPNLAAFFNAYWASHGAPTTGYLDVPMRVYLDRAGQVLLTNLQVTPTGSKLRAIRLPVQPQGYSNVTASFTVSGGSGPLAVGVDVGDNGSVDWTYTGSPTYPASLTTGNLATAINAYLSGRSGEVDVPIRIYLAPFAILNLADFSAAPVGQTDMQIGAGDIAFSAATPVETEPVTVTATLHNPGTLDSGSLTAVFYGMLPSGQPQGLPLQIGAAYVPNIPANGAATASILWDTTGFTGTVPVRVVIDPYNRVAETNEANNEAAASLTILTRPDLRISSLTLSNTEPVTNEIMTVNLTLVNGGQTQAASQTVALYEGNPDAGGSLISAQITAPLPGGTTTLVSLPWTPTTAGEHRLLIRVDRDDQVSESDEGNNDAWRDVYVGLRGPVLLDSGTASDIPYSSATGYGYIDESQPDAVSNCGTQPAQTLRQDPGGRIVYRFDHLLPGHFYHLDLTLFECDGAGRQEDIYVDGNRVAGPENLGDGQVHDLSLRLDPALYADRTIRVTVESPGIDGAVVSAVNLYDIDYRYADAGGNNDPAYPGGTQAGLGRPYGWLDGVPNLAWGTLPYQSVRIDQTDTMLRYQFDGLNPARHYQVHLTLWQPSGSSPARTHTLQIDGIATGVTVNSGDYQIHRVTADVPVAAYSADGRIVTQIIRTGTATTGAFVNEIALEESTLVVMPPEPTPTPTSIPSATPTPTVTPTVTPTATPTATPVPPDATIMHLAPAQAAAYAGVPITVTLGITNAHNLGSFEFTLIYNPTLVNVEAITLGPFPGSTGRTFSPTGPIINNTTGRATFGAFSLGATPPGPSGHGVLASVRLRPMAAGTAIVQVTDAQVADIAGTPLPVAVQHGTLIIQACLGDFDADGDVDIIDVQRIAYRWSSRCGDPLYEARYDLDNDCDIDIIDVQRVAYRWGTHCTTEAPAGRLPWLPLAPVTLRITPSEVALAPGETLALSVSAQQVVDLGAFELTLAYDPAVAEVVGVTLGAFPDSTGRTFVPVGPQINAQTGAAVFGGYSLGAVPPGPSGDGALALVTIRALAPGRSRFEITQAQVSNRAGHLQPVGALSSMEILVRGETHLHLPLLRYDR